MDETPEGVAVETRDAPPALVRRAATMEPATFNASARTVDVVFTTGAEVVRQDFWTGERWIEALDVTDSAVDLSRLNAGAPVLNAHSSYDLADVIGVVERAWVEGGKGYATLRFSEREEVAPIMADVRAGILRNISVGYSVSRWAEEDAKGVKRRTAKRWQPMEISFVPVPADAAAQVRSAAQIPAQLTASPAKPQESKMDEAVQTAPAAPDADQIRADAMKEATKAERARVSEIHAAAQMARLDEAWVKSQIDSGATADQARAAALREVAQRHGKPAVAVTQIVRDEGDTRMEGMEGWLLHRLDPRKFKLDGPATDCRGMSLLDMARASVEVRGVSTRGLTPSEVARMALGLPVRGFMSRGMGTTSDFANLLANTQSKRLLAAYDAEDRNFQVWARRRDLPDFKQARTIELGAAPQLRVLTEGATIEQGVMGEAGEVWNLLRYARNASLSYPAIVNDDLGGFDRIPVAFANAAANLELTTVYGILSANANMADGSALFASRTITVDGASVSQSNTTSGALSVANFSTVRVLLLRMRDATGQQMRVNPSVLIVPSELEADALSLFSVNVIPTTPTTTMVNPYRGSVQVVSSQFLTDNNDWFVTVGSGTGYEAVEYGYEQGMSGPELTSYTDPDVDGVTFSCRHSFGAKAVTFRTIARSAN